MSDKEAAALPRRVPREEDPTCELPRRVQIERFTPAERAIYDAVQAVEALPADVRLTDAVALLQAARDSVADYVDGLVGRRFVAPDPDAAAALAHQQLKDAKVEQTRAILRYTLKGYQAGENAESKHWRERAEVAEAQLAAARDVSQEPLDATLPQTVEGQIRFVSPEYAGQLIQRIKELEAQLEAAESARLAVTRDKKEHYDQETAVRDGIIPSL